MPRVDSFMEDERVHRQNIADALNALTSGVTQVHVSNGTWTKPSQLSSVLVYLQAPGGGGGSGLSSAGGGGGGAGGYAIKRISASNLGATETVTIPAGGASDTGGGTASFGSHVSCPGGNAGGTVNPGAATADPTGGDVNLKGGAGTYGVSSVPRGGDGAPSPFGGGGRGGSGASQAGRAGSGAGSGGGAGSDGGAGGAGGDGLCLILEFF